MAHRPLHIPGKRLVITKNMIEIAIANSKSQAQAARWIGVSYTTYKKWAKYYELFEDHKNQSGTGIKKGWASYKIPLEDICSGKHENTYSLAVLKLRLIDEGYMQEECAICSWNELNIGTNKICLTLDFMDGDTTNLSFDNIRLLCPNCYYSCNGFFPKSKVFCK
jgi:hypothetical protein